VIDILLLMMFSVAGGELVSGRSFTSPAAARELVVLLQNAPLTAFAAPDPDNPGQFVAVLYAGDQLLVIETAHESPSQIAKRIEAQLYRDVYLELQRTRGKGKHFVQDAGADGLLTLPSGQRFVDVIDEEGAPALRFNGDPKGQDVTEAEYNARFEAADTEYARMLSILARALENRGRAAAN
jgi:hypothetical protein